MWLWKLLIGFGYAWAAAYLWRSAWVSDQFVAIVDEGFMNFRHLISVIRLFSTCM